MRSWFWIFCLSWGLVFPGFSRAAGFDCAKARTNVEKMICANPQVSKLDSNLASLYKEALDAANDPRALGNVQRAWLKTRNACRDGACLTRAYGVRIAALEKQARARERAYRRGWALRDSWYKRLKWPAGCEAEYKGQFTGVNGQSPGASGRYGFGLDIYKLQGDWRLAVVDCSFAAYQGTFVALSFEQGKVNPARLLTLSDYERDRSGHVTPINAPERTGLASFNPASRTLAVLDKARGPGDCGSLVTFAFKEGRPLVTDARAQYCFDDPKKLIADPTHWPAVQALSTAGRGQKALTLKEVENRLVRGGYIETLANAGWAASQGAAIVPILSRMLGQRKGYDKELGGATGAFPFDALWALGHIPLSSALKVLETYGAAGHDPAAALAVKGWKLRARKKGQGYGVLANDGALLENPSAAARVVKRLKAGQAVQIERTMIACPGEQGPRGGPAYYDRVKLLPGGEQGYIGRAGDDFSPFL
ncbi:MAG: hypothetical protein P4L43_13915 [Syntrophobacteraceae bacterium]|nr:hypothetical protein [Syntrophobacteraceae bacterium]